MRLSVIIPAYNEERTVAQLLKKVKEAPLPQGMEKEVVVVDDGSTDRTGAIINGLSDGPWLKVLHQKNQGKTAAVLNGIAHSSGDIILIQDADLEYDPRYYAQLVQPILDGSHQVVYGSRFLGSIQKMRPIIRLANRITNITLNLMYGTKLTDNNTCFKVFKREALEGIKIHSTHFGFDTELTVKLSQKGIPIHEIPIAYVARSRAEGKKITPVSSIKSYLCIFKYTFNRQ